MKNTAMKCGACIKISELKRSGQQNNAISYREVQEILNSGINPSVNIAHQLAFGNYVAWGGLGGVIGVLFYKYNGNVVSDRIQG
jgi:hypothetical protein